MNDAITETGMTDDHLWANYLGVGGSMGRADFAARLSSCSLESTDRMLLAEALNDWYTDRGRGRLVR